MTFDVSAFMNAQFEGENDTKLIPCPVGEYQGTIRDVKIEPWASQDGTKNGLKMTSRVEITDEAVTSVTQRKPTMFATTSPGAHS